MLEILNAIDDFVWGPPLLVLLVGTGIYLTIRLGLIQVFKLGPALKLIFSAKMMVAVTLTPLRHCVLPSLLPLVPVTSLVLLPL